MKVEKFKHNIDSNGKLKSGGAVYTKGRLLMSRGEGCGLDNCKCSEGYWLTLVLPIKNGVVEVTKIKFDDLSEMNKFVKGRKEE